MGVKFRLNAFTCGLVFASAILCSPPATALTFEQNIVGGVLLDRTGPCAPNVCPSTYRFSGLPTPLSDGVLTVTAFGDLNNDDNTPAEALGVTAIDGGSTFLGYLYNTPEGLSPRTRTDSVVVPQSVLIAFSLAGFGDFQFSPGTLIGSIRYDRLVLEYRDPLSQVPLPAALPLFLSALAGLWGFSCWRQA